jgi:hypothetical protein
VRQALFHGSVEGKACGLVQPEMARFWQRWVCLQVRQAQRLAFEVMLGWVESWLNANRGRDTEAMALYLDQLWRKTDILHYGSQVDEVLQKDMEEESLIALLSRSKKDEMFSIFWLMEKALESYSACDDTSALFAFRIMLLCAEYTRHLSESGLVEKELKLGGVERNSLHNWLKTIERVKSSTIREFILFVIEQQVISQHLSVATRRFDGQGQRLRIGIEEEGLTALSPGILPVPVTSDRLACVLSLLSECGRLTYSSEERTYALLNS